MKKLILGILLAIAFIGCGKKETDIELYTSYEYKEDFIDRMLANGSIDKKLQQQLGDILEKLSKIQVPKAQEEINLWDKALAEHSDRWKERRRKERKQMSEWKEIQEYKNSLSATLYPELNEGMTEEEYNDYKKKRAEESDKELLPNWEKMLPKTN